MVMLKDRKCISALVLFGAAETVLLIVIILAADLGSVFHLKLLHEVNETGRLRYRMDIIPATKNLAETKTSSARIRNNILDLEALLLTRRNFTFSCGKLVQGNKNETQRARFYRKNFPYEQITTDLFQRATNNCDTYKRTRGYVTEITDEERSFPIAFSIVIHEFADQFERLLRALYRPHNYYCVHVDKKSDKNFHAAVKAITDCFDNVFIASKLEVVIYAGFTRLQADVNCMEELHTKYSDWKYVLNAAGTEFPLKSNKELVQLLRVYNGANIIGKSLRTLQPQRWEIRHETVVTNLNGSIYITNKAHTPPPFNLTITKGSAYAVFSRAFVDYVLHDAVPKKFLEWSRYTYSPDEQFWATLNNLEHNPQLKTPGGDSGVGMTFMTRATKWLGECDGERVHTICVFGAGDLPWLAEKPEFFANKFMLSVDEIVYSCMEELLKIRETHSEPWDLDYHLNFLKTHRTKN